MRVDWLKRCIQGCKGMRPFEFSRAMCSGASVSFQKSPELTFYYPGTAASATDQSWPVSRDRTKPHLSEEGPLRAPWRAVGDMARRAPVNGCQVVLAAAASWQTLSSGNLPSSLPSAMEARRPLSHYATPPRPRYAIVRGVPDSFRQALTRHVPESAIDLDRAREQHATLVSILKELVGEVIELPAQEQFPDCPFVEDTAVVVGSHALCTRIGAPSREGEPPLVAQTLRELGLTVHEMRGPATLDGGDVLQIGHFIFVGLGMRTNKEGVLALKEAFPEKEVVAIPLGTAPGLHLKSVMTSIGGDYMAVEANKAADDMFQTLQSALRTLMAVPVPCPGGANTCLVGSSLLYPSALVSPEIATNFSAAGAKTIGVDMSEFHKADGGVTCLSILID